MAKQLFDALQNGPVCYHTLPKGMNRTDLFHAIQELRSFGILIERIDAGGSPTWKLIL
jgi:biotin operon repressor